ncbi:hypothetical protein GCM10011352_06730 [Marinobacterium zhoushanense]|uniref:STAS domain-containing protein n=1 Tax=Marinobacterium zhoushanense TaxID=1679163 RepID=A0ABQ1K1S1_9GAMM|nr:STAS domain-containing protein [Marinobacterium zhoushanense]GGB83539.1 hypothetical protein GCM10011352_06730 [Marinobacterium zhoushanense]
MTKVEQSSPGVIALSGELLFGTIMAVRAEVEALLSKQTERCQLDFSQVTRVDSSALALWLACCRLAARNSLELSAINIPSDLDAIADLVGLDGALRDA